LCQRQGGDDVAADAAFAAGQLAQDFQPDRVAERFEHSGQAEVFCIKGGAGLLIHFIVILR
jgi:hypothetical protein